MLFWDGPNGLNGLAKARQVRWSRDGLMVSGFPNGLILTGLAMDRWLDLDGLGLDALVTAQRSKDLMGSGLPDGDRTKGLLGSGRLGKVCGGTTGSLEMTRWG